MSSQQKSRDELEQEVEQLTKRVNTLTKFVHETLRPQVNERLDDHEQTLADVEALAQNAIGIAQTEVKTSDAGDTKKGIVLRLLRRQLVKEAHKKPNSRSAVTTTMARNLAKPDLDPARRTVHDAMQELSENWEAFEYEPGDPGSDGKESRILCNGNLLEPSLIRGVAESLTQDDLRETLITQAEQGGGV